MRACECRPSAEELEERFKRAYLLEANGTVRVPLGIESIAFNFKGDQPAPRVLCASCNALFKEGPSHGEET